MITVVDREENVDHRSGPGEFVDSKIVEKEKVAREISKVRDREGRWPTVIVYGHIKEKT